MIPKETKSVGKPMKPSNKKSHHVTSSNKRKVTKKQDTTSLNTQEKKKSKKHNNLHDSGSAKGSGNSSVVMKSCEPAIAQEPYILL